MTNGDARSTGGGGNDGGAVRNYGVFAMTNSTISDGVCCDGSAVFNQGTSATITNSTFSDNGTTRGAALGACCSSPTTVTNSTFTGNNNGAIDTRGSPITVSYSTIASNTGTGIVGCSASNCLNNVVINNTIVANNTTNCSNTIVNGGNNLQFSGTTCGAGITLANPLLGPLANNGGSTQTMALLAGSPTIDAANALSPATDQRGVARPQGPSSDIGAFEAAAVVSNPVPTITNVNPSSVIAGSPAFTLTVNGTNYIASSVVNFNGAPRTTTFVSATQLTAAILASDVMTAGSATITATNPAPGGGTSNAVTLVIAPAAGPVDTLSPWMLSLLALVLALAGFSVVTKHS